MAKITVDDMTSKITYLNAVLTNISALEVNNFVNLEI